MEKFDFRKWLLGTIIFVVIADVNFAAQSHSLVGKNPCTQGPSYWCASYSNAQKCGIANNICVKYRNNLRNKSTVQSSPPLVGNNPCTWGPSFWCASLANAKRCGLTESDCAKYGGIKSDCTTSTTPPAGQSIPGSNPCTWGPSYWCASATNAIKCGLTVEECDKYGGIKSDSLLTTPSLTPSAPSVPTLPTNSSATLPANPPRLVGSNPCSWGPSYWCASSANAKQCNFAEADCAKYGGIKNATATIAK